MPLRIIQPGNGDQRDLVVVYHLDPSAAAIQDRVRQAAGPDACVLNDTGPAFHGYYSRTGAGGIDTLPHVVEWARGHAGAFTPRRVILVGFSAGGQGVTAILNDGTLPDAAIVVDGWHCALGARADAPELRSRRALVDAARRGERVLVASHTQISTESVRPTPQHPDWHPFTSTRATLELLTGWQLREAGSIAPGADAPVRHEDGRLVVRSYAGGDAAAHERQMQLALPRMLAEALSLLRDARQEQPTSPEIAIPLGERALAHALAELARGAGERPPGSNAGPDVARYLMGCERDGRLLGLTAGDWCAAFASWCAQQARRDGEAAPHGYRASVAELWRDAVASGHARPAETEPRQGWLAIFGRSEEDPRAGGHGHVGRVERVSGSTVTTIDGNVGDRVSRAERARGEVLGWIAYDEPAAAIDGATAARLWALADAIDAGVDDGAVLDGLMGNS